MPCPEEIGRDLPQGAQLIGGNVVSVVLGETIEEDGAFGRAIGEDDTKSCRTALPAPRDSLFDKATSQIGIDKSALGASDGFTQRVVAYALLALEAAEGLHCVDPHGAVIPLSMNYST